MFHYNRFPRHFDERGPHDHYAPHHHHGPRGPHRHADEFAAFGYSQEDFPEPPMRESMDARPPLPPLPDHHHRGGRHHDPGFNPFEFGSERGHRGFGPHSFGGPQGPPPHDYYGARGHHHGPPPPPPPQGPHPGAFGMDGPESFHSYGQHGQHGHHGPPPPPPPPHHESFHGFGGPHGFDHHGHHPPPPPPGPRGPRGPRGPPPPPPPPFDYEFAPSEDEIDETEKRAEPTINEEPSYDFHPRRHHTRHPHHHHHGRGEFPGEPPHGFEMRHQGCFHQHRGGFPGENPGHFGMRSFGFGGQHHGPHGPPHGPHGHHHRGHHFHGEFGFMENNTKPERADIRVLESKTKYQVQVFRHGSGKGFKNYEISYKSSNGEVFLSIESEIDDVHKSFKFKQENVLMDETIWDVIGNRLVVTILKVKTSVDEPKDSENVEDEDVNMDSADAPAESKKAKKSKKKSKSKSKSAELEVPSRSSSTETWSSISTPSEAAQQDETTVHLKIAQKEAQEGDNHHSFKLPDLSKKPSFQELSESESDSDSFVSETA